MLFAHACVLEQQLCKHNVYFNVDFFYVFVERATADETSPGIDQK